MSLISRVKSEKARFFEIADRLTRADDATERAYLKEALARLVFGA
jgi:hypothetical protein